MASPHRPVRIMMRRPAHEATAPALPAGLGARYGAARRHRQIAQDRHLLVIPFAEAWHGVMHGDEDEANDGAKDEDRATMAGSPMRWPDGKGNGWNPLPMQYNGTKPGMPS